MVRNTAYIHLPSVKTVGIFDYLLDSSKVSPEDKEAMKKYRDNPSSQDAAIMRVLRDKYDNLFQESGKVA